MRCPLCKTGSMRSVDTGESEICQCASCKAAWFDSGKIRELTAGRFPENIEPAKEGGLTAGEKGKISARMSRAWGKAALLFCLQCSRQLAVVNFQNTGTPVFQCRGCGGILISWDEVVELAGKFGFMRKHASVYQAMGESMAGEMQESLQLKYGPNAGEDIFLKGTSSLDPNLLASFVPLVIPLKNEIKRSESYPVITFGFLALMIAAYLFSFFGIAGMDIYQAHIALPSGVGLVEAPLSVLLLVPFFHGGFIPLLVCCFFLFVLGDDLEDRIGHIPFFFFYLACGVIAGAMHIVFGKAGAPAALGSAGAVAGVLGAYIVFFPHVPITVYRAGEVTSMPAYFLACAWLIALFLWGWLPLPEFFEVLNPAPYSLAGNIGGFAAGAFGAIFWRSMEP